MSSEEMQKGIESGHLIPIKKWVAYSVVWSFIGGVVIWLFTVIFWIAGINNTLANQKNTNFNFDKRITEVEDQTDRLNDDQKLIIVNLRAFITSHGGTWIPSDVK